jgi:uncharacterized protein YtpQ (UPF0354 family)
VKIYAATVETLKKTERQGETQFTTKPEPPPRQPLNANAFYFFESNPSYDATQGFSIVVFTL